MPSCRILTPEEKKEKQDARINKSLKRVWTARAKSSRLQQRDNAILAALPQNLGKELSRIELQIGALCIAGRGAEVPADLNKRVLEILSHPAYISAVASLRTDPFKAARSQPA